MPRRKETARKRVPEISPALLSLLSEGLYDMPEGDEAEAEAMQWEYFTDDDEREKTRALVREPILDEWIRQRPGTRPQFWWLSDAPEKQRRRLGGIGDAAHDHLACTECFEHGIPKIFISKFQEEYYNGRAHDIHGRLIKTEYHEGHFAGRGIDPNDPPRYESEAAYLKRHGLLTRDEKKKLTDHDFEPEIIEVDDGD